MCKILDRQCRNCPEAYYIKQDISANNFYKCPYTNKSNIGNCDCNITKEEYNKKHNIICNQCYYAQYMILTGGKPPFHKVECKLDSSKQITEVTTACDKFSPLYDNFNYPTFIGDDDEDVCYMPLNASDNNADNTIPSDYLNSGTTTLSIEDVCYDEPHWTSDNKCSNCKTYALTYNNSGNIYFYLTKYCPNCGVKLKEKTIV